MRLNIVGLIFIWLGFLLVLLGAKDFHVISTLLTYDYETVESGILPPGLARPGLLGLGLAVAMFGMGLLRLPRQKLATRRIPAALSGLLFMCSGILMMISAFLCRQKFREVATTSTPDTESITQYLATLQTIQTGALAVFGLGLLFATISVIGGRRPSLNKVAGITHFVLCVLAVLFFLFAGRNSLFAVKSLNLPGAAGASYLAQLLTSLLGSTIGAGFLLFACGAIQQLFWLRGPRIPDHSPATSR